MSKDFHLKTPLILSKELSDITGRNVYLKLDNLQPSGSFKIRGIGRTCKVAFDKAGMKTKLIGSSGGNAGVAMAFAASKLKVPLTVFIPETSPKLIVDKMKTYGANVVVAGNNWNAANAVATKTVEEDPDAYFIHPYDQETTWEGHSTIVDEIKDQLKDFEEIQPTAIVTCVGGGGLAIGIMQGMERAGWNEKTSLVIMETEGANCFHLAMEKKGIHVMQDITSVAKSLGALSVSERLFKMATEARAVDEKRVVSKVVNDKQAISAVFRFANDHRMMVEPACGAVLSSAYEGLLNKDQNMISQDGPVVLVVCGGNLVTTDLMEGWRKILE